MNTERLANEIEPRLKKLQESLVLENRFPLWGELAQENTEHGRTARFVIALGRNSLAKIAGRIRMR